jgi:hypothetical protein
MLRPIRLFTALSSVLLAWPALAQAPQGMPTRIRGTVVKLADHTLLVRSRDGEQLPLVLAPNFAVSGVVKERPTSWCRPARQSSPSSQAMPAC